MRITTAAEIRLIEEKENEVGTPFPELMERAGTGCAKRIMELTAPEEGPVVVLCGSGKNGGDGFVISRVLKEAGYDVTAVLGFGQPKAEDAVLNHGRALDAGVPVLLWSGTAKALMGSAALLVDCLFGIGFRGAADEVQRDVFETVNASPAAVVSVDVPSGVVTDTGEVLGSAVKADLTLAISTLKPLHVFYPAREYCGVVETLDIGLSNAALGAAESPLMTLTDEEAEVLLPARARTAHKNDFGHVLSVCGSYRMPGAACLCVEAAVRSGAGLVTAAYPDKAYPAIAAHLTECMSLPLPSNEAGQLCIASLPALREARKKATVLVAGCGLGQSPEMPGVLEGLLENTDLPMVLDADALNALAERPEALRDYAGNIVITPHPGEMARLAGCPVSEVLSDRVGTAKTFADAYGVTVLLKGADTVVAGPGKVEIYVNTSGNAGLAKGGSGDTLSGILAAFLAQGTAPFEAACLAAFYHGRAAELCGAEMALRSICATDLLEALPFVLPD